jgi:hypothetical protein
MNGDRVDTFTPGLSNAQSGPGHAPGTPCLVASADRTGLHDGLDLLREAGEEVPARLYRRGSRVRGPAAAGGTTANVSLSGLVAEITQALELFDPERSGLGVSSEHPVRDRYGGTRQLGGACGGIR